MQGKFGNNLCSLNKTRPDTRPSVADGWAGVELCVFPLLNLSVTDQPTNGMTDRRMDGPTDRRTKPLIRVACPQLKSLQSQTTPSNDVRGSTAPPRELYGYRKVISVIFQLFWPILRQFCANSPLILRHIFVIIASVLLAFN